ncbi:hypothetical protein [Microbacterium soli]|uniref:Uncharacterized protein n=1 Tax=Microbacterium soli TaxID=446075 RepID=A0ABP7NJZ1_9MICO
MSDLLDLLGDEWALPDEDAPISRGCKHPDRDLVTHGCRESGRAPREWRDVGAGGYVDGMGRWTACMYCSSCIGTGRTSIRDPWTDELLDWAGANCLYCRGTGFIYHAYDCAASGFHERNHSMWRIREPIPAAAFGVTFDGRTLVPGEFGLPAGADA